MSLQTVICLALLTAIVLGGWLWWHSLSGPVRDEGHSDTDTAENVQSG